MNEEIIVHKCRFLDIVPSSIVGISSSYDEELLAIGRQNGNIEIINIKENFAHERVIATNTTFRKVSFLKSHDGNFSILCTGLDGGFNIYSLDHLNKVCGTTLSYPIWDLKIINHPDSTSYNSSDMSIQSSEETLLSTHNAVLYSSDNGSCSIVFIPFDHSDLDESSLNLCPTIVFLGGKSRLTAVNYYFIDSQRICVIAGSMDGSLYQWEVSLPGVDETELFKTIHSPSMESDLPSSSIPWSIEHYSFESDEDGLCHHLVVGDSNGVLSFWDASIGVLLQSIQHHKADILQCCIQGNDTLFTMGVDTSIVQYKRGSNQSTWNYTTFFRPHTNDIITGLFTGKYLFSGGIDTKLHIHHVDDPSEDFHILPFYRSNEMNLLVSEADSDQKNLICSNLGSSIQLWRLGKYISYEDEEERLITDKTFLIEIKSKNQILSYGISNEAQSIAYSDHNQTRVLFLEARKTSKDSSYEIVRKVQIGSPSIHISYSDHTFIRTIAYPEHRVEIFKWNDEQEFRLDHSISNNSLIQHIKVSSNGKWLVYADLEHNIFVYDLENKEIYFKLPRFEKACVSLEIGGDNESLLFIGLSSYHVWVYNIEEKELTQWSNSFTDALQQKLYNRANYPMIGISCNSFESDKMIVYGHSWLAYIKMDSNESLTKKNSKVIKSFNPLYIGYVSPSSIAIVERPWISVLQSLPNPFYRKRYGT